MKQVGIPLKFSDTPARIAGHAPELGADTEAVLSSLGYNAEEIKALSGQQK